MNVQGSDAEVLRDAMLNKPEIQPTNVDTQPFFLRTVLGHRLRAENAGKIPILLYWHPNIDECASTSAIPGIDSKQIAKASIFTRIKTAFGMSPMLNNDVAIAKLLVSNTESLHYVADAQLKSLAKHASQQVNRMFQTEFEKNWDARRKEIKEKLPTWDEHDCQMVVAFHIPEGENSILLHSSGKCHLIDTNHRGDDGLLRLYVSLEFRRALRDRLISQQRHFNLLSEQRIRERQMEQKRLEAEERRRIEEEEKKKEEERRIEEEKNRVREEEDRWQYDQDDDDEDATLLQRAGGTIVNGVQATGGAVISGASMVVGGATLLGGAAWTGANIAGSVATGSASTVANLFRR